MEPMVGGLFPSRSLTLLMWPSWAELVCVDKQRLAPMFPQGKHRHRLV